MLLTPTSIYAHICNTHIHEHTVKAKKMLAVVVLKWQQTVQFHYVATAGQVLLCAHVDNISVRNREREVESMVREGHTLL